MILLENIRMITASIIQNMNQKLYGNSYLSSINALYKNPVSRRDNIINLCYLLIDLYLGSLPWVNLVNDENGIKKNIELKKIYTKFYVKKV